MHVVSYKIGLWELQVCGGRLLIHSITVLDLGGGGEFGLIHNTILNLIERMKKKVISILKNTRFSGKGRQSLIYKML